MQEPYSPVTEDYEHWSCNDVDSTETELIELIGALVRATKPKVCVEVGAYIGLCSAAIGSALERNGRGHLYAFEASPLSARVAAQKTAGLPVTVHRTLDVHFDPATLPGTVDFLFVDGNLDNRGASLRHWRPWLSPDNVVAVHDSLKWDDVRASVETIEHAQRLDIVTPRGLTLMRVVPDLSS
jgi:predicted O-methyltransferase YrrM